MGASLEATETLNGKVISIPSIDKTLTKDGYAADAKVTGEAIENMIKKVDIVNDLVTENPNKPLSAMQGAELRRQISMLTEQVTELAEQIEELAGGTA